MCKNSLESASGYGENGKAEDGGKHTPAVYRFMMSRYRGDKKPYCPVRNRTNTGDKWYKVQQKKTERNSSVLRRRRNKGGICRGAV